MGSVAIGEGWCYGETEVLHYTRSFGFGVEGGSSRTVCHHPLAGESREGMVKLTTGLH